MVIIDLKDVSHLSNHQWAILAQRPRKSKTEPSEAQKAQRERFKQANQYARAALADPATRAHYEKIAAQQGGSTFAAASTDYLQGKDLLSKA